MTILVLFPLCPGLCLELFVNFVAFSLNMVTATVWQHFSMKSELYISKRFS